MTIFDDLQAEQDLLDGLLAALDEHQWAAPSGAPGWSIADVVLHLAQSEEAVAASLTEARRHAGPGGSEQVGACGQVGPAVGGQPAPAGPSAAGDQADPGVGGPPAAGGPAGRAAVGMADRAEGVGVDEFAEAAVRAERADGATVLARWRAARAASVAGLRAADPAQPLRWVAAPLKPATLATTRLAEHWAHGLDITGPLGLDFPDTPRLRHIAWLAHRTLPYALAGAGESPAEVSCALTAPDGDEIWRFGPASADSAISGPAGAFCRVAVRRLDAADSGLRTTGPYAATALLLLRTYAA